MILCNSSDRIKRQLKAEKRKRIIRKIISIITLPLKLCSAMPPARSLEKEKRHRIPR